MRKLALDLSQGFARHWHSGDAFLSQHYNALSMSFPVGEQYFIDSVREFFWGKDGMVWRCTGPLLAYLRRDFHPDQEAHAAPEAQGHTLAARWLADNAHSWRTGALKPTRKTGECGTSY